MKSQFARIKNRASSVSTRALAVMLCFVMLLTAVGAGTMMTAIAADGAATPVADAAQKVIDIADSVDVSAAKAAEDKAPTETVFDKLNKQYKELAASIPQSKEGSADEDAPAPERKKIDLAASGWSTSSDGIAMSTKIYTGSGEVSAWSVSGLKNSDGWQDFDILDAGTYDYKVVLDSKWYGNKSWGGYSSFDDSNGSDEKYCSHRDSDSDTGNNSSAYFPAGQYVLKLDSHSSDNKAAYYYLYRKKAYIDYGWGSGGWTGYNMDYSSGGDGVYKYTITGNGQQLRFRARFVDGDTNYNYYPSSTDEIRDNTSYESGYSASNGTSSNYWWIDTQNGASYTVWLKNGKLWIEVSGETVHYYLWGGSGKELNATEYIKELTYNASTTLYDGTYTFDSTNWTSLLISTSSSTSNNKTWSSYGDVGWSVDTYDNAKVYQNYSSSHREPSSGEMTTGALNYVEINNYSTYYGLKVGAKVANTTVNLSYDATNKILHIWGGEVTKATVYAKDGAIRSSSVTYADIANTKIYKANGTTAAGTNTTSAGNQSYETYTADKGETIVIKTTIGHNATGGILSNASTLRSKYYVRGFCINGEVSELLTPNTSTGVYTLTYTVPENYDGGAIEITPIYYLVNTTTYPVVTFRVNGFTDNLKEVGTGKPNWGDSLYAYPFYGKLGGHNNAFGAYPGQPLVYFNGQYQMQIPTKSTAWAYDSNSDNNIGAANIAAVNNTYVSGITMSNGYYDTVHKEVMGYGDNSSSADHVQTYDYGDFYKIFNEKDPDNIVFEFKYKTKKHNFTDDLTGSSLATSSLTNKYGNTNGNGFELLKNYHEKNVDLFGTPLNGNAADPTLTPPVYVVSTGGVNGTSGVENVAGYFASAWRIYVPNDKTSVSTTYKKITSSTTKLKNSIPPEVLILEESSHFNNTTYPSADSDYAITDWKTMYETLEAYRGLPVYISYESAQAQKGSKDYATSGANGATRNDGRWLYSSSGENITSNIKIQYSDDSGSTWIENSTTPKTGLSAYFTNSEVAEGATTYSTYSDPDQDFEFEAKTTNPSYMFVGWYFDNGVRITTENSGKTERSGSYTLVARFMKVTSGQLVLQHSSNTNATYSGSGTSKIAVQVTDAENTVLATYPESDTITIPSKYITNTNLDYKIKVTLTSTPSGYDTYATTSLDTSDSNVTTSKFFNNPTTSTSSGTTTNTFQFTVGQLYSGSDQIVNSLLYNSYYNKTTFNYNISFSYTGRKIANETANRSYSRTGTLTPAQVSSYVTGTSGSYRLAQAFIATLVPHESNLNETLIWSLSDSTSTTTTFNKSFTASVYTGSPVIEGTTLRSTARKATFNLGDGNDTVTYDVTFGQLIKNGENYITAAETYDGNRFQYWEIKTAEPDSADRKFVAYCYNREFNYVAYDDYYITAVYGSSPFAYGSDGATTSISYLDTTRNQWNNNGNGGYTTGVAARDTASDMLFNDFALSYGYNGERLYESNNAVGGQAVEVGFIVERFQKMDIKQDGTYDTTLSKYIATGDAATTAKSNAEAAIAGLAVAGTSGVNAGSSSKGYATYTNYKIDRTKLDNKNRIEFFYALYNSYGQNADGTAATTLGYKNYVYRAYSYIKVGTTLTVTDDPAYFIMYDEATK